MQAFMRRVEINPMRTMHRLTGNSLEELERIRHRLHQLVILMGELGFANEVEIPVLGMMEIGESTVDQ